MSVGVSERERAECKRTYAYVVSGVQQCANDLTAPLRHYTRRDVCVLVCVLEAVHCFG